MKTILSIIFILGFQFYSLAQQFVLEAEINGEIQQVFDIENDGVYEYMLMDSLVIFDGASHQIKYYLPEYTNEFYDERSFLRNVDFNSDGNKDFIIRTNTWPDEKIIIFDVINNQPIFEFNPSESNVYFNSLLDIDGDDLLEIIFVCRSNDYIYKTYIYSTGVSVTSVSDDKIEKPNSFKLNQNFPNPFNPSTKIRYSINAAENISIKVYDISGQLVKEFAKEYSQPGEYEVVWDGKNNFGNKVASGVYFYQLQIGKFLETKKMVLLK